MVTKIQLKWGIVKGKCPEEDTPDDWAEGSAYRTATAGLVQRLNDNCTKLLIWGVVGHWYKKSVESITNYHLRLSNNFRVHSGWTWMRTLTNPMNCKNFFKRLVTLDPRYLFDTFAHAHHAEKMLTRSEE